MVSTLIAGRQTKHAKHMGQSAISAASILPQPVKERTMMNQDIHYRRSNSLRTIPLLIVCVVLILSRLPGLCQEPQIKELPLHHGVSGKQTDIYWHDAKTWFD